MLYCPKCGAGADEGQNYCRKCGVNLALVSKAVNLGEVIARGDGGILPKIRGFMGDVKLDAVSEQVGKHLEKINESLKSTSRETTEAGKQTSFLIPDWSCETKSPKKARSAADRRAKLIAEGFPTMFFGIAMMVLFFVLGDMLVLKIPPEKAARIPFDLAQAARFAWVLGLFPTLNGLGKLLAAGFIKTPAGPTVEEPVPAPQIEAPREAVDFDVHAAPPSVTEHTTARLERHAPEQMRAHE